MGVGKKRKVPVPVAQDDMEHGSSSDGEVSNWPNDRK